MTFVFLSANNLPLVSIATHSEHVECAKSHFSTVQDASARGFKDETSLFFIIIISACGLQRGFVIYFIIVIDVFVATG